MEISDFAEQVLTATTLNDKLWQPAEITDITPAKKGSLPEIPGRPKELQFDTKSATPFPKLAHLDDPQSRGWVFHFFANHELLALELMALILLKFPEAPESFRKGLVHTLMEEQDHLKLYQQEMKQSQVTFGEIAVNPFFWNCMAPLDDLMTFVCAMSLTFEQANLDYCCYYAKAFEELGDVSAAKTLEQVYHDEIQHVQHGLKWFRRWKPPKLSEWDAYCQNLVFPLTPRRAKGKTFDYAGRQQAGLTDDFVSELEIYQHSKGRSPNVFYGNLNCEQEWTSQASPSKKVQHLIEDCHTLPMFLCQQDDVVLTHQRPSAGFLKQWQQAGWTLPEWVTIPFPYQSQPFKALEHRRISEYRPWGWNPVAHKFFAADTPLPKAPVFSKSWSAQQLELFLKETSDPQWLCDAAVIGKTCHTVDETLEHMKACEQQGYQQFVVKAPIASSGQRQWQCTLSQAHEQTSRVQALLQQQSALVVEPWLEKQSDLSIQGMITPAGKTQCLGVTPFVADPRGRYCGSYGRLQDTEHFEFLNRNRAGHRGSRILQLAQEITEFVGRALCEQQTMGPFGIDLLVYQDLENTLKIKPIVEINPRYTMGHLTLSLGKSIHPGAPYYWCLETRDRIEKQGFSSFTEFVSVLQEYFPIQHSPQSGKLISGALPTNDPSQAKSFLGMLLVAAK